MREAKLVRARKCRQCEKVVNGDARAMREHEDWHDMVNRAEKSGITIAAPRVWTREGIKWIETPEEVHHGN